MARHEPARRNRVSEQNTVDVDTIQGSVSGLVTDDGAHFLGIPYAAAPVGDLLFRRPRATEAMAGSARRPDLRRHPAQAAAGRPVRRDHLHPDVAGEECLNVNVWTPDPDASGLPVLVWIHGGGFTTGSSAVPSYDGATFARDGVVCVSFNYRLGVYGYGYLPDAPAPANRGLLDQIAALTWVRENITGFGGNPDSITVAGESAGAMSIWRSFPAPVPSGAPLRGRSRTAPTGGPLGARRPR